MKRARVGDFIIAVIVAGFMMTLAGSCGWAQDSGQVIRVAAKKFVYTPKEITLKKGVPVVLEFTSEDVLHGFNCSDLNIRSDIMPGKITSISFTPNKAGIFPFHCDNFCGSGHETMTGTIKVIE